MSTPTSSGPGSGTSTPVQANTQLPKDKRPALAGVKTRQRKGVAKARAKYEPTVFRDELLKLLQSSPSSTDWDAYLRILESAANELDIRKYNGPLLELLIVGRLLAPGGALVSDGSEMSSFCVLGRGLEQQKDVSGVLGRLIRRYKYLQKPLEDTVLPSILQNANKLDKLAPLSSSIVLGSSRDDSMITESASLSGSVTPTGTGTSVVSASIPIPRPNVDKLAAFVAHTISSGLTAPIVFSHVKRDHLVKDGTALAFITSYCRTYLSPTTSGGVGEGIDQLTSSLRKAGAGDLLEFFPLPKRNLAELQKEFSKERGLDKVGGWYGKIAEGQRKDEILRQLKEILGERENVGENDRTGNQELVEYLQSVQKSTSPLGDQDLVAVIWQALMSRDLDINHLNKDQLADKVLKHLKATDPVLAHFTANARTEIALINAIQVHFYDNSSLMTLFPRVLQLLYNDDIISSSGLFYWFEKGAKPNGKQIFLKATEPLIKAIRASEEEDDEEEDEE